MNLKNNVFLTYLESDKFYNEIYDRIFSWCKANKNLLLDRINGYNVSYISEIEDVDMDFKNVWIDSKDNTKIEFDVAVEITVEVVGVAGRHYDRDSYTSRLWVKVSCSGSLNRKLKDFFIHGVEEFSKNSPKKPLSGNMVPFISKENYNKYANEILEKYYYPKYPEARLKPVPIDVDELANNMGLNVINTSISKDGGVFGQIFFADANVNCIYNKKELARIIAC